MSKSYIIANAFSLQMINVEDTINLSVTSISRNLARLLVEDHKPHSIVGHADIAAVMSTEMGTHIHMNRESIKLSDNDVLIVGQYVGGRLPEGTTTLPADATIEWYLIHLV